MIPLTDLYHDDGIRYLSKERDEVLTEVHLPPSTGVKATYWKLRRRGSIDFPVLGVGVAVRMDGDIVQEARIHLGAVHSFPVAAAAASQVLSGRRLDADAIAEAADLAKDPATPMDNTDFTLQWRRRMVAVYVDGALRELAGLPPLVTPSTHGLNPFAV